MPRINDELLSAQFENVATDPVTNLSTGRIIWNTTEQTAKIYDGSSWTQLGAGGGGNVITAPIAAETFDCSSSPRMACISQKQCVTITAANSWIDIDDGGGEVSVQVVSIDSTYLKYDLGVTSDIYDLCKVIEDALNASALILTYSVSYDNIERKITIADSLLSTNFTIKWNDGAHSGSNIGNAIGFLVAANDSGANTYTADNPIDDSSNNSFFLKTFATQTDSAYLIKSRNFRGVVQTTTNKMSPVTIEWDLEVDGLTTEDGEKYYTDTSAIVIESGVNDAIDFNEGGAEKNATLTAGTYLRGSDSEIGYKTLCAEIKTQLESANGTAVTYTVTFDKNTNKFSITASSGTFQLRWLSGTNTATACYDEIGWSQVDTALASTHTSTNAEINVGNIVKAVDVFDENSVYVGHGLPSSKTLISRDSSESMYDSIYASPGDWLATPLDKDYSEEFILIHQHENASGVGARIILTTTSPATYKFQYKTGTGASWQNSTYTVGRGLPSAVVTGEDFGGDYHKFSKIFVDENGSMVCALNRRNTTNSKDEVWSAYSEDGGDNWTMGNGNAAISSSAVNDFYVGSLYARANKAVCLITDATNVSTRFRISDYSSGYGTWNSAIEPTNDYGYAKPSAVLIQSYPSAGGNATHRIILAGHKESDNYLYVQHYDAVGANEGVLTPFGTDDRILLGSCLDSEGTGNKVLLYASATAAGAVMDAAISTDSDSSFAITDKGDIQGGVGSARDNYNGYSSAANNRNIFNSTSRCALYGDYAYIVHQTDANTGSKKELSFFHSTDAGASWEIKVDIGQSQNNQECSIQYLASRHALMVTYNYFPTAAAGAAFLTNGQVWARFGEINGDGSISWHDAEQIDGGKGETDNVQFVTQSASADGVSVSWEEYNGSYDTLKSNNFN